MITNNPGEKSMAQKCPYCTENIEDNTTKAHEECLDKKIRDKIKETPEEYSPYIDLKDLRTIPNSLINSTKHTKLKIINFAHLPDWTRIFQKKKSKNVINPYRR
jgi:hypothetical protein